MVRNLVIACLIYVALVLQPSMSGEFPIGSFRPWLPGIAVVACALMLDGPASLVWAAVLGLGIDCQSVDRPGIHLILGTITLSGLLSVRPDDRSQGIISIGILVFGASFVWRMAASIVYAFLDRHAFAMTDLATSACWDAFSSLSVTIGLMLAWRLVLNSIRPQCLSSMSLSNQWSMLTEK